MTYKRFKDISYTAGACFARLGGNINNSYPFDTDEFMKGHKSVPAHKVLPKTPDGLLDINAPEFQLYRRLEIEALSYGLS